MLDDQLRSEIGKWTEKIEEARKNVRIDEKHRNSLKNIDAYTSDSKHFLEKGDLIRSFEAIIWAWAWIEILKELGILKEI
ncbi:MAG: DUF357 domain-containing protein [Candidatus Aenigmarchaeota archaeon]|nr:DUF357 domain-containing protein [Candidatus Aenigmarchaeota archaeon]